MKTHLPRGFRNFWRVFKTSGLMLLFVLGAAHLRAATFVWDGTTNTWPSVHWYDADGNLVAGGIIVTNSYFITNGMVTFAGNDTFGDANTTASPLITVGGTGVLASGNYFNTLWNLTLQGGTLLPNGGVNLSFPSFQLDGTLTVSGTSPSLISAGYGNWPQVNIGGTSTSSNVLTVNVADVTGDAYPDLIIAAALKNGRNPNVIGTLLKTGPGTLALTGTNFYTGSTIANGGWLLLQGGHTSGGRLIANGGGTIVVETNAGTYIFTADAYSGSCDVGESGGTGTLILNGGLIIITNSTGAASMRVGVNGAANGTLTINAGTLMVPGRILIGANNTATVGTLTLNGGVLDLGYMGGFTTLGSDPNRGLIWFGNGTSTINLNGGLLRLTCLYGGPGSANAKIFYNGALIQAATNNSSFDSAGTFSHNVKAGGARLDSAGFDLTFSKPFLHDSALGATPDGGWTKLGAGTVTLAHNGSTYTGPVVISNGLVRLTAAAGGPAPASSPLGAPAASRTVTVCSNATLYFGANDVLGNHVSASATILVVKEGGLVTNAATYNTFRNLILQGGELRACGGVNATWPAYQLKGTVTVAGDATSRITLAATPFNAYHQIQLGDNTAGGVTVFDVADGASSEDLLVTAVLVDGNNSSGVAVPSGLTKVGNGTMVLGGANFYTGPTTVSNGTLLVNGSLANTPVLVAAAAVLGGSGGIGGPLTVDGTLAPGASLGTLTVSNTVVLRGNTVMEIQKTGGLLNQDRLVVAGELVQGGTLTVAASGDALAAGDQFVLFTAASYAGGFTNLVLPELQPDLAWYTGNLAVDGSLSVISTIGPPVVLQQPASATNVVGAAHVFSVLVVGAPPFSFQWLKDGQPIPGATNASLSLPWLRVSDAGAYMVLITNAVGDTASAEALLTVLSFPPTIVSEPVGAVRRPGQSCIFSLVAAGSPVLLYQWFKDGQPLPQATNSSLSLEPVVLEHAGNYQVVVTNDFGSATSAVARLEVVATPPSLRYAGSVEGSEAIAWRTAATNKTMDLDGDNLYGTWAALHWKVGATNQQPTNSPLPGFAYVADYSSGQYQNSGYTLIDKLTDPSVRVQAGIGAVQQPGSFTFELTGQLADYAGKVVRVGIMADVLASNEWAADKFKGYYLQWTSDGAVNSGIIPLRNGNPGNGVPEMYFFDIAGAVPGDRFTLITYNAIGGSGTQSGYAGPVTWDVGGLAPVWITQPANTTNYAGASAMFTVTVFGSQPVYYQWFKDEHPVADATNATLAISCLAPADAGVYLVVASNAQGAVTSTPAMLVVITEPPTLVSQPQSAAAIVGQSVQFGASAIGSLPFSWQWFKDGEPLEGATNATLALAQVTLADAGVYMVRVSNAYGATNSSEAMLTVFAENGGTVNQPPPFEWLKQNRATLADAVVRFNEIMYHPPGNNPSLQWVELVNVMMADVDLSGWVLDGGIHYTFPSGTVLAGGGYLVVAANVAAVSQATGLSGVLGPFTGNLANEGERLVLKNHDGRMMDEMIYGDESPWPPGPDGSGATLAKISPYLASSEPTHWRSSPQIGGTPGQPNFPVSSGSSALRPLVAFFDFNTDASDLSGNGFHGVVSNAVLTTNGGGYEGECFVFNGANAFIQAPIDINPTKLLQVTIGAWVNVAGLNSTPRHNILSCDNDGFDRGLTVDSRVGTSETGVARYCAFGGSVGLVAGAPASITDGWKFVAAVFDQLAGTTTLYVEDQVFTGGAFHGPSLDILRIGNNPTYGEYFNGKIDNVFIFRRALTSAQIQAIRAGGASAILALGDQLWQSEQAGGGVAVELPGLAFNEVAAATDAVFKVELQNFGSVPLDLADFTLAASTYGASNRSLPAATLNPGEFFVLDEAQLGFHPGQNDKLFLLASNGTVLVDAVKVKNHPHARQPDAIGRWMHPAAATFGASNAVVLNRDVVINEIMYHHAPSYPAGVYAACPEQWVELFNRGTQPADLSGWQLDGGIQFVFPPSTVLAAGGYLVVARDAAALQSKYPGISILGNFTGQLSHRGELIALKDAAGNVVNEVHYFDNGRWPAYADGGGSSLELIDPYSDNRRAESWAASDESSRSVWQTVTYRGVATTNFGYDVGYNIWNEFNLGLLDAGEFLLDDVSVIERPGTPQARQLIQNGSFDADVVGTAPAAWRVLGNHGLHGRTVVEIDPSHPGNKVLHVVATGPTDFLHNQLETTLKSGGNIVSVVEGREYEISFRVRRLAGCALLNSRLYANWLQRTTVLNMPEQSGTPGTVNSRRVANAGPTYTALGHSPAVPAAGSPVTISIRAYDPQDVAAMTLFWRLDGSAWNSQAMTSAGGGLYQSVIPGQAAGAKVQFYIQGTDAMGARSWFPAAGPDSRAMLAFNDQRAAQAPMHNLRVIMTAADTAALYQATNRMSNQRLGATIIYNESEIYYDVGIRLKASAYGRTHDTETGLSIDFDPEHKFRDAHDSISIERSSNKREILAKHLFNQAGRGIAAGYDDVAWIITPRTQDIGTGLLSMTRTTDLFLETQYGPDGSVYNFELLYTPTTTVTGDPEAPKLNFPYSHTKGEPDLQDLGDDKEAYRWNFQLRNKRTRDDFSLMMAAAKAMEATGPALDAATRAVMDVDQWLRCFAMQSLIGTDDFYTRLWNHNLRFYQRLPENRLVATPWDLDRSFNLSTSATLWGTAPNNAGNTNRLRKLIEYPPNLRAYFGHLLDLISVCGNSAYATRWANHYAALTGDSVIRNYPAYLDNRAAYIRSQTPAYVPFSITTSNGLVVNDTAVTLTGQGWVDVYEIRLGRQVLPVTWTGFSTWEVRVPLAYGTNLFTLQAFNRAGTLTGEAAVAVTSTISARPLQDFLRITEIMYNPPSPPTGTNAAADFEFVELKNIGPLPLDLTGAAFTNGLNIVLAGPAVTNVPPGGFALLVRNLAAFASRYDTNGLRIAGEYTNKLNNAGERLVLVDADGAIIHDFKYDGGWYPTADGLGFSLVIRDAGGPLWRWDRKSGWRPSAQAGGSPGSDDPESTVPEIVINEVMARPLAGQLDWVELFNPGDTPVAIGGWFLTDNRQNPHKFRIPDGCLLAPRGYVLFTETELGFGLSAQGEEVYLFSADAVGNLTGWSDGFPFGASALGVGFGRLVTSEDVDHPPQRANTPNATNAGPQIGPVVITEIHYAPVNGIEFVELRNVSQAEVPLFDPAQPSSTWRLAGLNYVFPTNTVIPSCGVLLVTTTNEAAFRAAYPEAAAVPVLVADSSVLSDDGENVELLRPDSGSLVTVDRVRYDRRGLWDTNAWNSGLSLQRRVIHAYGNEPTNWMAGAPSPGRTPPVATVSPQTQLAQAGGQAVLTASACAEGPVEWQWRFEGTAIPEATNPVLVIDNVQLADAGVYDVRVSNAQGMDLSLPVRLEVNRAPVAVPYAAGTAVNTPLVLALAKVLSAASDPDGDTLMVLEASANSVQQGNVVLTETNLVYTPPQNYAGNDAFTCTVGDGRGGTALLIVLVNITNEQAHNIVSWRYDAANHAMTLNFAGIPGRLYRVQFTESLVLPVVWTDFATNQAPPGGLFSVTDTNAFTPNRFYRTCSP